APPTVADATRATPVVDRSDVLVVGGGPAGVSAAVAAARGGARVTLVERYPYLGGLASGGMVLVLDDMVNGAEITTTGLIGEAIERLEKLGLAASPPLEDRRVGWDVWRRWARWGCNDFRASGKPQTIVYAVAFDPDGWKRVSDDLARESGVNVRLHSWFSEPIVEDGRLRGVVVETKSGRQALLSGIVVDATGDLDVAARAGAPHVVGGYMVTTVFRLGNVDTETALRFEHEHPEEFGVLDRQAKRLLGGAWDMWWLKTPLPGIVWCNCPHMTGYDALRVEDMTAAELEGRRRIASLMAFARAELPGFAHCYLVDVAPQLGVRQTRLLEGEYVVTKQDVLERRHFPDTVCRGRDYYTPYRALLPRNVDQLIVAGRHYSAEPQAQKISREIPPCMVQGQAAGIAAALALSSGPRLLRGRPGRPEGSPAPRRASRKARRPGVRRGRLGAPDRRRGSHALAGGSSRPRPRGPAGHPRHDQRHARGRARARVRRRACADRMHAQRRRGHAVGGRAGAPPRPEHQPRVRRARREPDSGARRCVLRRGAPAPRRGARPSRRGHRVAARVGEDRAERGVGVRRDPRGVRPVDVGRRDTTHRLAGRRGLLRRGKRVAA